MTPQGKRDEMLPLIHVLGRFPDKQAPEVGPPEGHDRASYISCSALTSGPAACDHTANI